MKKNGFYVIGNEFSTVKKINRFIWMREIVEKMCTEMIQNERIGCRQTIEPFA